MRRFGVRIFLQSQSSTAWFRNKAAATSFLNQHRERHKFVRVLTINF